MVRFCRIGAVKWSLAPSGARLGARRKLPRLGISTVHDSLTSNKRRQYREKRWLSGQWWRFSGISIGGKSLAFFRGQGLGFGVLGFWGVGVLEWSLRARCGGCWGFSWNSPLPHFPTSPLLHFSTSPLPHFPTSPLPLNYLAIPKPNFSKMFLAAALVRYWVKVLAACGFLLALITAMG